MTKINQLITKKVKEIIDMAEEEPFTDEIFYFYLDWTGLESTDVDLEMVKLIELHNGNYLTDYTGALFPVFSNLERAVERINDTYKDYKVIYIFNNAPIMMDLFQRVIGLNNKGANIKLVNMKYELFSEFDMDNNNHFNGYLAYPEKSRCRGIGSGRKNKRGN